MAKVKCPVCGILLKPRFRLCWSCGEPKWRILRQLAAEGASHTREAVQEAVGAENRRTNRM